MKLLMIIGERPPPCDVFDSEVKDGYVKRIEVPADYRIEVGSQAIHLCADHLQEFMQMLTRPAETDPRG